MAKTEKQILLDQLDKQERTIRDAFALFVLNVKSDEILGTVNAALEAGDIEGALDIVDLHIVRMSSVLPRVFTDVGEAETASLAAGLGTAGLGLSFNPTDTRSANLMRENRLSFVREIGESQRAATRQALTRAFETGAGPRQTATVFRDSLGLTARQEQAVVNYRNLLESNSRQALARDLRDRRFDRTVERAINTDTPLTSTQVDRMVERYRERAVQFRAEVVGRTEGIRMTSMARDDALRQTVEETGIDPDDVVRTWNRIGDGRQRDAHDTMQDQTAGLDESFTDGDGNELRFPGDPAAPIETTAQCRCVVTVRFKR